MPASATPRPRPRVGISQCLLGAEVRHDGGHKRERFLTDVLGDYFEWVSVCPEVEAGMGTPREALRLVRQPDGPKMITIRTGVDWTGRMNAYSEGRCDALAEQQLSGFVLKKDSPSCGLERVKVYDNNEVPSRTGRGLFAEVLQRRYPNLPIEEEGRLNDRPLRENFIGRVWAYDRWRRLRDDDAEPADLIRFHTGHKLLLMAHDPATYYAIGRIVAEAGTREWNELLAEYEAGFMQALARPAPAGRQVNALQHLMGLLKEQLDPEDKADILEVIEQYRAGIVPLVTPLALIKHHLRATGHPWVEQQVYLDPYPSELGLRSHV